MPLLIPHLSSFGYDGFLRIWVYLHPLLLLFIVTTRVPFILLTMMSSMNELNTSRLIVILSVIVMSIVLSSFSLSPPKINLQISSPNHFLRDALVIWLTTSSWSHIHLEFEGGLLTYIMLWALGPVRFLVLHTYAFYIKALMYIL